MTVQVLSGCLREESAAVLTQDSNSNSTFIALNLRQKTDSKAHHTKTLFNIKKPETLQGSAPRRKQKGDWKFRVGMLFQRGMTSTLTWKRQVSLQSGPHQEGHSKSYVRHTQNWVQNVFETWKLNQSGEPQEICHQIDFDECYMHYVWEWGRVQSIWGYHCVGTYIPAWQS